MTFSSPFFRASEDPGEPLPPLQGPGLLLHEPGGHGLGAEAQEEGHVVEVPHAPGVDEERGAPPQGHPLGVPLHEGPVHRGHGEAHVNPHASLEGLPVGEDEDLGPFLHGLHRFLLQAL